MYLLEKKRVFPYAGSPLKCPQCPGLEQGARKAIQVFHVNDGNIHLLGLSPLPPRVCISRKLELKSGIKPRYSHVGC